jgi:hypothetical protein
MPHLQILREVESLGHGDVSESLEDHHSNRSPWQHVANNKLSQDIQSQLPVSYRLNKTLEPAVSNDIEY